MCDDVGVDGCVDVDVYDYTDVGVYGYVNMVMCAGADVDVYVDIYM